MSERPFTSKVRIDRVREAIPSEHFEEAGLVVLIVGGTSYVLKDRYGSSPAEEPTDSVPERLARLLQRLTRINPA